MDDMSKATTEIVLTIIVTLFALLTTVVGWNVRNYKTAQDKLRTDHDLQKDKHSELAINISENYAKKTDLNAARRETNDSLKRVYDKMDSMSEHLDKKITEIPNTIIKLMNK